MLSAYQKIQPLFVVTRFLGSLALFLNLIFAWFGRTITVNRKPDVIRSLVIIFMAGLVISGVTNLGASEKPSSAQLPRVAQSEAPEASGWWINKPQ